ncbi:AMP-binding protein, partial [Corynebacterium bovis]
PPAPATPPLTVHNLYGPTEAAVDVTAASFTADTLAAVTEPDGTVAVGTAVPGTRADVVDDLGRPVPVGTPGELILGGIQLATGYVGAPATTAVAFTADPTAGGPPGARVYRTGDVATLRDDGLIVVHGRRDRQVKIRGQRLEPAEVESVITGGPVAACVAVVTTVAGEPTLAAYVVPAPGVDDATAVSVARRRAADALPGSVQPVVRAIASVPVTVNGKVDVAALPSPLEVLAGTGGDADERDSAHPPAPPGTASATERAVADIVARLLEVGSVPPTANFFDLGGNSLTAVRLATELRAVLGPGVTVAHVIAGRTPRGIVTAVTGESAYSPIVPLRLRTRDDATSPPAPSQHPLPPPLFCVHPAGGLGWAGRTPVCCRVCRTGARCSRSSRRGSPAGRARGRCGRRRSSTPTSLLLRSRPTPTPPPPPGPPPPPRRRSTCSAGRSAGCSPRRRRRSSPTGGSGWAG